MNKVPDTNTFHLTDVTAVVGGNSLTQGYTNSIDSYFDSLYKGNKDRQSNFRNYTIPDTSSPPTITVDTVDFLATDKTGTVNYDSTLLMYGLTPTNIGYEMCGVVLTNNGAQVDTDTIELEDGVAYSGTFTLPAPANYGDNYKVKITSTSGDKLPPSVPINLVASDIDTTSFTLSWDASTDNVAVEGYRVYKDGVLYGHTSVPSMSITGLTASTSYSMTVEAYDAALNGSEASSALAVTTLQNTPTVVITTFGFNASNEHWTISCGNVLNLYYWLTPTNIGTNIRCSVVIKQNGETILCCNTSYDAWLTDGVEYSGQLSKTRVVNCTDKFEIMIMKI